MSSLLAHDLSKNIVIYINDFYPELATGFTKLSQKLGRPLRGIMLVDAERKASGKNKPDKESFFEEIIVDFFDDVALRKAIKPLEDNLLIVSCDSERSQLYFKKVIPHVPYVLTPTETSLEWSTDKGEMRKLLSAYDSNISPRASVVRDSTQQTIEELTSKLTFPLILKPTNLDGSILVNRVNDEPELQETLINSFSILEKIYASHRGIGSKEMIVEEFIEGDLYSTNMYVDEVGKVYVLPFIHCENSAMVGMEGYQIYKNETYITLTDEEITQAETMARKAMHAVGLRSTVAHVELFHTPNDEWKIVELGARPGGWRQEMYGVSYGIDHQLNGLYVKIGLEPEMPTKIHTYSATFSIYAPEPGIVDSIAGIEEARSHPNMHTLHVDAAPGDEALPSTKGGDMLVGGLMHNVSLEQLNRDIESVRASIVVKIKTTAPGISNE